MPQGNYLCGYLKQQKISFFFFFSYTKSENRKVEQVLGGRGKEGGGWYQ
jgi:hypothetical protein